MNQVTCSVICESSWSMESEGGGFRPKCSHSSTIFSYASFTSLNSSRLSLKPSIVFWKKCYISQLQRSSSRIILFNKSTWNLNFDVLKSINCLYYQSIKWSLSVVHFPTFPLQCKKSRPVLTVASPSRSTFLGLSWFHRAVNLASWLANFLTWDFVFPLITSTWKWWIIQLQCFRVTSGW